ncbi:MAG: hypothetical protein JWQ52_821 [Phenylobacterium sp.]|jgi:hypothetical protein|nr:hypothetical protein [Phenylobacterium sp.]
MEALRLIGDALWIIALSVMAGASREAGKRMEPDTRMPMQFGRDGEPTVRAKRNLALAFNPVLALMVGIALLAFNRKAAASGPDAPLILFGVRATAAALFALAHLRWLKASMAVLEREGALKP